MKPQSANWSRFHESSAARNASMSEHLFATRLSCRSFFSSIISRRRLPTSRGIEPKRSFKASRITSCTRSARNSCKSRDLNISSFPPSNRLNSGSVLPSGEDCGAKLLYVGTSDRDVVEIPEFFLIDNLTQTLGHVSWDRAETVLQRITDMFV